MEMEEAPSSPRRPQMGMLEMELDHDDIDEAEFDEHNPLHSKSSSAWSSRTLSPLAAATGGSFSLVELAQGLVTYVRLWSQVYPRSTLGLAAIVGMVIIVSAKPWAHTPNLKRNHLEADYSSLAKNYDFQKAQIHHWCLFGGNDKCNCEDPTVGLSREEAKGWSDAHHRNKQQVQQTLQEEKDETDNVSQQPDVVFLGDQTFQAWGEGQFLDKAFEAGRGIASDFNETFRSSTSTYQGLALGIFTDMSTNLLWRINHGEMPPELNPKVWWISIGANDLALGMCSEDVVILGILRIAEEIALKHPEATVVIQGLLPRSNHKDGSLQRSKNSKNDNSQNYGKNNIWAYRTEKMTDKDLEVGDSTTSSAIEQALEQRNAPHFDYYIWPSILAINQELKGFCEKHPAQFVYFDADDLFVEKTRGDEKRIKHKFMPNAVLLSREGHKILMEAVETKLKEIVP